MSLTKIKNSLLNDEVCFKLWTQLGTIRKVCRHLTSSGIVNPNTNKSFTAMSVWIAAYRYILENIDEAWKFFQLDDPDMCREEFEIHIIKKAATIYQSRRRFMAWIRENNFEKYKDIYGEYYRIRPITRHNDLISDM